MTPDEIRAMARGLAEASGGNAHWIEYLVAAISGGALSYFGSYVGEKGKGRATKEDVSAITAKVEEVRSEYQKQVEDWKAHHQLRLVAAERRLQAHQEAFEQWLLLYNAAVREDDNELSALVITCQHWYAKNCIYLTPKSRGAFTNAYQSALAHKGIKRDGDATLILHNWQQLEGVGNIFLSETLLPSLDAEGLQTAAEAAKAN